MTRWLYHIVVCGGEHGDPYAPASLGSEGFVHCSYRPAVRGSAARHFSIDAVLEVLQIDPRKLSARIEEAHTPHGPMPHVFGPIPRRAIARTFPLSAIDDAPDVLSDSD